MNKIKIIWDFRGPVSQKIADHHEKHLQEFFKKENKKLYESGKIGCLLVLVLKL